MIVTYCMKYYKHVPTSILVVQYIIVASVQLLALVTKTYLIKLMQLRTNAFVNLLYCFDGSLQHLGCGLNWNVDWTLDPQLFNLYTETKLTVSFTSL